MQRNILLTRSLVYYQRLELRSSHMEARHRVRCGQRVQSFCALSRCTILPKSPHGHQLGSPANPIFLGFYGSFLTWVWLIESWSLVIELKLHGLSPSRRWGLGVGLKILTLDSHGWLNWQPPPIFGFLIGFPKVTSVTSQKNLDSSGQLGCSKGFRSPVPGMGQNYISYYKSQYHSEFSWILPEVSNASEVKQKSGAAGRWGLEFL